MTAVRATKSILPEFPPITSAVYGPMTTQRFGQMIGINFLGGAYKVCSLNCTYCDLGPTEKRLNQVKKDSPFFSVEKIEDDFRQLARQMGTKIEGIDSLNVAGNGEPSLTPFFLEAIEKLCDLRNELAPQAKIQVLTSGSHLDQKRVQQALKKVNSTYVKLDVGEDSLLRLINDPLVRLGISDWLQNVRMIKDFHLQSCFIDGPLKNIDDDQVEAWMEVVGMARPMSVHLHTVFYKTANENVLPASEEKLYHIASRLKRRTGIETHVFTAP